MRKAFFKGVVLLTWLVGVTRASQPVRPKAPDFTLPTVNGDTLSLSDLQGNVVILNFWATWCPPCRAEIPSFIELQKEYGDQGLTIVGVALDKPEAVVQFYKDNHMNYPVVFGTREVAAAYGGITGIPTTFILDRKGRIVKKFIGMRSKEVFREEILSLLQEPMD